MAATKTGNGKTGGANRGGSIKIIKVGQQKVDLKPVIKATKLGVKNHSDLKRDGRHVAHKPNVSGGKMKYSHMDIATKDKRDGASVTRTIALRGGH